MRATPSSSTQLVIGPRSTHTHNTENVAVLAAEQRLVTLLTASPGDIAAIVLDYDSTSLPDQHVDFAPLKRRRAFHDFILLTRLYGQKQELTKDGEFTEVGQQVTNILYVSGPLRTSATQQLLSCFQRDNEGFWKHKQSQLQDAANMKKRFTCVKRAIELVWSLLNARQSISFLLHSQFGSFFACVMSIVVFLMRPAANSHGVGPWPAWITRRGQQQERRCSTRTNRYGSPRKQQTRRESQRTRG